MKRPPKSAYPPVPRTAIDLGYRGTVAPVKALLRDHPIERYTWQVKNVRTATLTETTDVALATVYDPADRIVDQREFPGDEADLAAEWAARRALTLRSRGGTP